MPMPTGLPRRCRDVALASSLLLMGTAQAQDAQASATQVDWYASVRLQTESVHPDERSAASPYTGLRDAYSRVGVSVQHALSPGLTLSGQLELPLDLANLSVQDPYDQGDNGHDNPERLRIARIGLQGNWGALHWGQQWMPYYNAVAAPVDAFSSYYSGFATYTVFRVRHTVAYTSPSFQGLSVSAAYAPAKGNRRSTSRIDDERVQVALSYDLGATRLAAALDDRGDAGYGRNRLYGLSASHQAGAWQVAAKYERFDTGNHAPGSFSRDDNEAVNLLVTHQRGANTYKAMLARVEGYGENIVHLGIDHQYKPQLKFFAEFYSESETAALTTRGEGLSGFRVAASGGHVWVLGLRHDF